MKKILFFWAVILVALCLMGCKPEVKVKKCTVTFDANGAEGTVPSSIEVEKGENITLPSSDSLSKVGYIFDVWNTSLNEDGKSYLESESITVHENLTLYAIWKPNCLEYSSVVETNTYSVICKEKSITSVIIPSMYKGKAVTDLGRNAFNNCSKLSEITIPSSVTNIGFFAFGSCSELEKIALPDSVTSIGGSAFHSCNKLEKITLPSSVTSIGNSAFASCSELTEITIPSGVTSIEKDVFSACKKLEKITIPSSVTVIGNGAFSYCSKLQTINYDGSMEQWNAIEKKSSWNESTGNYTIYCTDGEITKN